MCDEADGGRPGQHPGIAQRGHGRHRHTLRHAGLAPHRREQHRHDVGAAQPHHGIAQQRRLPEGDQRGQQDAAHGQQAAHRHDAAPPYPCHDAVAGQAAEGHGEREGCKAVAGLCHRHAVVLGQHHRAPVHHRAFHQEDCHAQHAQKEHLAARQCKRRALGRVPVRQDVPPDEHQQQHAGQGDGRHRGERAHPQVHDGAGGGCTQQAAQAVEAMKARHQRPLAVALDDDGLDVHHAVEGADHGAKEEQRGGQREDVLDRSQQRQTGAQSHAADHQHLAAAVAGADHAGNRHGQQGADAQTQQDQAQLPFIDARGGLGHRHERSPGGSRETGQQEQQSRAVLLGPARRRLAVGRGIRQGGRAHDRALEVSDEGAPF